MELNAEQIMKALKVCGEYTHGTTCNSCPYMHIELADNEICSNRLSQDALALIKSQEQKIFELEKRLKECENGYEGTLALERAKIKQLTEEVESLKQAMEHEHASFMEIFGQYGEKCDRLTEENERLRTPTYMLREDGGVELMPTIKSIRADTVREMQAKVTEIVSDLVENLFDDNMPNCIVPNCHKPDSIGCGDRICIDENKKIWLAMIDQIAKEMLEGDQ